MTFSPYEAEDKTENLVAELLQRINLPEGWSVRVESCLRTLARHDVQSANKLAGALQELGDAFKARGEVIDQLGEKKQREQEESVENVESYIRKVGLCRCDRPRRAVGDPLCIRCHRFVPGATISIMAEG